MPQTGQRKDPYANFNFRVEIDGITRAAFHDVSGLESTTDVHPFREGGENTTLRKLPMLTKYSDIVLKWGITDDRELYDWHRQAVLGNVQRRHGSIVGLDRQEHRVRVTLSIGIALFPADAESPEELWRRANQALLVAKRPPKNQFLRKPRAISWNLFMDSNDGS